MIKNIKQFHRDALINSEKFRQFVENFESEILRGISTLAILSLINSEKENGVYGYKLARDLKNKTNNVLVIEEGTLYPILRKLKKEGLLVSQKKEYNGRLRSYNIITKEGKDILNHLMGFFTKLIEALAPIMDVVVKVDSKKYFYCPNCANKLKYEKEKLNFCPICGLNIEKLVSNKNSEVENKSE